LRAAEANDDANDLDWRKRLLFLKKLRGLFDDRDEIGIEFYRANSLDEGKFGRPREVYIDFAARFPHQAENGIKKIGAYTVGSSFAEMIGVRLAQRELGRFDSRGQAAG
jgi:hypothetical protein